MATHIQRLMLGQLLLVQSQGPTDIRYGICQNLTDAVPNAYGEVMRELDGLFKSWPLFSGDITFPVPCPKLDSDMAYLMNDGGLWDRRTTYGKNRWALLEHCIVQLQIQLSKT